MMDSLQDPDPENRKNAAVNLALLLIGIGTGATLARILPYGLLIVLVVVGLVCVGVAAPDEVEV